MNYTAHLIGIQIPEVLRAIGSSTKTGDLLVLSQQRSARLSFLAGQVVHATADNVERLGLRLVQAGHLDTDALHTILSEQAKATPVVALSSLLHERGLVAPEVLEAQTRQHIVEVLREILTWSDGTLLFESGDELGPLTILNTGVNVDSLLLHVTTTDDEAGRDLP
ncbi:MAG: DUF4388 domain-containing protein [Planctomycetota bacterium]